MQNNPYQSPTTEATMQLAPKVHVLWKVYFFVMVALFVIGGWALLQRPLDLFDDVVSCLSG